MRIYSSKGWHNRIKRHEVTSVGASAFTPIKVQPITLRHDNGVKVWLGIDERRYRLELSVLETQILITQLKLALAEVAETA